MSATLVWGVIPGLFESFDKSYELMKKVLGDLKGLAGSRQADRELEAITELRDRIGEIYSVFSKIEARIRVAAERNDVEEYRLHEEEIRQIRERVNRLRERLQESENELNVFFYKNRRLMDLFHMKLEMEGVDDYEPEPGPDQYWKDFLDWLKAAKFNTGSLLDELNGYIKEMSKQVY